MSNLAKLTISTKKFKETLKDRIGKGRELMKSKITTKQECENLERDLWNWHEYNVEFVKQSFEPWNNQYYKNIKSPMPSFNTVMNANDENQSLDHEVESLKNEVDDRIRTLEHLLNKADLIPTNKSLDLTTNQKLHLLLEKMIKEKEYSDENCFSPTDISKLIDIPLSYHEIEYLCERLIEDEVVRDSSSKDGFQICLTAATHRSFYGKKYISIKDAKEEEVEKKKNELLLDTSNNIFIVHGHNNEVKLDVARTVGKLGLNDIILHEQSNNGNTIIEKLEKHSSNAGFAVILLTDDDLGKSSNDSELQPRSRQNVILEMGLFLGLLGRKRVAMLYTPNVELPSDLNGLIYIKLDREGSWKTKLSKELRDAGYKIDINNII